MFKVKTNDKAFKQLDEYAKSKKIALKEVLLSDEHLKSVCDIFYEHMPKPVKWTMNKEKFTEFYKNHRETFVAQMNLKWNKAANAALLYYS